METIHKWEEYDAGFVNQDPQRIHVTLNKRCVLYLNGPAIKALGDPDSVVLYYDPKLKTIGVKRASVARRNAYRLKAKSPKDPGQMLYAANFCNHYGIRPSNTIVFTDPEVDSDEILILNLNNTLSAQR